jgi:choline dehydrogenase
MCCPTSAAPKIIWNGETALHGAGGEWRVRRQRLSWEILRAVQEGATEFGILPRPDFNDGNNEGSGFFEVNQRAGVRWNTAKGFLRPALRRGNLRLVTCAHGQPDRALGGPPRHRRGVAGAATSRSEAWPDREVILAAGAINSPKLLELSGIGQTGRLADLGIATLHDLPGVGENLQDHLQIRTVYKVARRAAP